MQLDCLDFFLSLQHMSDNCRVRGHLHHVQSTTPVLTAQETGKSFFQPERDVGQFNLTKENQLQLESFQYHAERRTDLSAFVLAIF